MCCYGFFTKSAGFSCGNEKKTQMCFENQTKKTYGFCKICVYQSWMFDSEWWVNWRWTHTRMYMSLMYLVNDMHASCTWLVPCLLLYVMYLFSWQTCWYCESTGIFIHTSYSMHINTFIYAKTPPLAITKLGPRPHLRTTQLRLDPTLTDGQLRRLWQLFVDPAMFS